MKLPKLTRAERRGFLLGVEQAALRIEDWPDRISKRMAVQTIRSLKEKT